ncbi:MAG: hypothetical protein ACLUH6_11365 [Bacteroides faecis]|jgi:hypothetical protein|uniref:Uncharacterized protein n=1 Tax=Bacteroides faecis TaxID=674529 RepID=A0A6N2UD16_9BACE|nr:MULTISPECIES: hypothetical protein [Bacteroidaceae]MCS2858614.1 hypothetical protein [Phocaeicola vulgatus]
MKKEIVNRIKQLGGNVANVKGVSLQEDLCAITFDTALYQKPEDTPWQSAEDTEPIEGLGDWVDENMELFNSDRETFYKKMVDTYYTLDEEPRRQLFWIAKPFTPLQEGTPDFEEWNDWFSDEAELDEIIQHSNCATPAFVELLYTDAYPNNYFICVSDLNIDNPIVWSTDHEEFFTEVTNEGTLENFLNKFMTKEEFIDIVKRKMEQ